MAIDMFHIKGEPQEVAEAREKILTAYQHLEFIEEGHQYFLHGQQIHQTASGISHRFIREPFDPVQKSIAYAARNGQTPEYWQRQWRCNSFRSTTLGTKTHEFGESYAYYKNGLPERILERIRPQYCPEDNFLTPIHPKEEAAAKFINELPATMHLVLNEAKVHSGLNPDPEKNLKELICGTFDMLYWNDGGGNPDLAGFIILDYKTNREMQKEFSRKFNKTLLPPFDNLYEEPIGEYTLQLSLYSLLLEDIGIKAKDRILVWLKDDATYEFIHLPDVSDTLREIL